MSELRKDPITGNWVVIAAKQERSTSPRPACGTTIPQPAFCPFCEGQEEKTPAEIHALRRQDSEPDTPGWRIRVVNNKYPTLKREGRLSPRGEGIYDRMNGVGIHEVMIEGPTHHTRITQLPPDFIPDILEVYRQRLLNVSRDSRLSYGMIFKNVGEPGKGVVEHNHSQLIATPVVPDMVAQELAGARRFYDYRGRCIYCDILDQEMEDGRRVIHEGAHFLAIAPYASRFPYESWIVPKAHRAHFHSITTEEVAELAAILQLVLVKLDRALDRPPMDYVIHSSPFNEGEITYYHWHLEIQPRVVRLAGFEFGTGFHINTVAPEEAAEKLRSLEP